MKQSSKNCVHDESKPERCVQIAATTEAAAAARLVGKRVQRKLKRRRSSLHCYSYYLKFCIKLGFIVDMTKTLLVPSFLEFLLFGFLNCCYLSIFVMPRYAAAANRTFHNTVL